MASVLKAEGLGIVFGGLCAVSEFECDIHTGELVGLIGPNGAGKTTVFNMLSGIYRPSSGEIFFTDKNGLERRLSKLPPDKINRAGVARTFQNIRLFKSLSVLDNVLVAKHQEVRYGPVAAILRLPSYARGEALMLREAMELLEIFGLSKKAGEIASNLPYGEQRKLEIARALASRPRLLLLDEPAAGMNPQETQGLMDLIRFIRDRFSLTILLIEHDMNLVMGICERLIVLDYGKIIARGLPGEIRKNPEVIKAYLGQEGLHHA